jgi:hypothetical protein
MSLDPNLRAASEAAEGFLNWVSLVSHFGPAGAADQLFPFLTTSRITNNLFDLFNKHVDQLNKMREEFAAVSDGPVKWEIGRGWSTIGRGSRKTWRPLIWSSGHEAATGIACMTLQMLVEPLSGITDSNEQMEVAKRLLAARWKALAMTSEEVASLQERIRRERAKVCARMTSVTSPLADGTEDREKQYVTRDQVASLVKRNKDTVADWFNHDPAAPEPAVEGGGGRRHEYLWVKVRPWLEKRTGRSLPILFPDLGHR